LSAEASIFQDVKEFNMFTVADIKINMTDKTDDRLTLEMSKGDLSLLAKVELLPGYPTVPPQWCLKLVGAPKVAG
jgi:hypothetical protein